MVKKGISSLELAAIVAELQFLVRGKFTQVYHQEKEIIMQLHSGGKQLLKVVPGKLLCLTDVKNPPLRPSGFCMQLRKHLNNSVISAIYQHDSERIVVFELQKKEKYYVIVELFSKGNVVLCDDQWMIVGLLQRQIWKDRNVAVREKYIFPSAGVNWNKLTLAKLKEIISKSEKKNLATSLATEIGFGGTYAEELCLRAGVDKDLLPAEVTQFKELLAGIKEMIDLVVNPSGFAYEDDITPFELSSGSVVEKFKTYNEAINTLNPYQITSPYDKRIISLKKTLGKQEEALVNLGEDIVKFTEKGERIYEKYQPLQKLLDIVSSLRKEKEWTEVGEELKKNKKIKSVDLKSKSVVIEL